MLHQTTLGMFVHVFAGRSELLLLHRSRDSGCTSHWAHCGFKAGYASVVARNGLRFSGLIHPGSASLQRMEINLSSESQGLILFLANFLSYMTVMLDYYMRQVTVQTVKIELLPGATMKHDLN